ncbi:MAG: transporter substrate-binding domain-containing protein [Rhodospirillales bacterium]|nr:transporter substrate-binding domain-containing protein [Rhodospirillales bacterium]
MSNMLLRIGLLLIATMFFSSSAGASNVLDRARERGHLVAAAMPDALPQSGRDEAGNLTGFDIAVAEALGKQLGLDVSFVVPSWQAILDGGWHGAWDFAVVSMTPTPEREKALSFPAVYRYSPAVLVVREGNSAIKTIADASGKTIGVKQDTTYQQYLNHDLVLYRGVRPFEYQIDRPTVRLFPDKQDAMMALAEDSAGLDAIVTSLAHAQAAVDAGLPVRIVPGFLYFEPLAVAIDNSEPTFGEEVSAAVEALRNDGTLRDLSIKWFGVDLTE